MPPKKREKDPDYKPKTKVDTSPRESSIRQLAAKLRDNVIGKSSDNATNTSAQATPPIKQSSDPGSPPETVEKSLKQKIEEFRPFVLEAVETYIVDQFREGSELTSDEEEEKEHTEH